jgi:UPF0755 protein
MTEPTPEIPPPFESKGRCSLQGWLLALYLVIFLSVLVPVLGIAAVFSPGPLAEQKTIVIAHGTRTSDIGRQLANEKAIYSPLVFRIAALVGGPLKAGEYAFPAEASAIEIARILHQGLSVIRSFTAAEGLTSAEIVHLLNEDPALSGTIDVVPPEGSLLPETYYYTYNDSRAGIIARMQNAMRDKLNELWVSRDRDLPLRTQDEALALASIIEKETGKAAERPRIAGVFYNRLRLRMRLQSDPTVIYALTKGRMPLQRALTHEDLYIRSPLNTYTSDGIPPQPICNPGRAALEAALRPERHTYLYFVADGTGGHVFASDLGSHNRNVSSWRKIENAARR